MAVLTRVKSSFYVFTLSLSEVLLILIFLVIIPGVFSTLARMAKLCVLRLTPSLLCFIFAETAGSCGGVSIWSELSQVRMKHRSKISCAMLHLLYGGSKGRSENSK